MDKRFHSTVTSAFWGHPPIHENIVISPAVAANAEMAEERPYAQTLLPLVNGMWQIAGREQTPFKINGVWEPFKERR